MFYSTDILNPRKGRLAVVWLMATGSFKCEKPQDRNYRDIISVRISNTCEEILRYVLSGEKRAKGRFSLYLSTMLMFGTIKVYRSQINFLLKEALEFHEKIKGDKLELKEDLTRAGKIVTLPESHVLDRDWTPMAAPARTPAFVTPRKRGSVEKGTTPSRRSERDSATPVLREAGMLESEVDMLAQLATDWIEETPTRARAADITLQEDVLQLPSLRVTEEAQALMKEVGPLDLGPSFATWEGPIAEQRPAPTIDSVTKRLDLEEDARGAAREEGRPPQDLPLDQQLEIYPLVAPEQPTTTEEPGPLEGAELVLPATEKTPQQPTKPDYLLRKKGAAPPEALADQTTEVSLQVPTPHPPEPIELRLEPLLKPAVAAPVRRRRRRLRIDKNIAIPTTEIRAQIQDYTSTKRCETSAADVANVLKFKRIPGVRLLTVTSHRPTMSTTLTNLLKSRYNTHLAPLEDWDFLPTARRQLKLDDMSREEPRATGSLLSVDLTHIADGSMLQVSHLDTSKGSSSRSIHLTPKTAQLEPVAPLSILQETEPLLPIQEEQGFEIFPPPEPEAPPAAPLTEPAPPIQEALQVEAELRARVSTPKPDQGPPPRLDVRVQSGFEDIGLATPPGMSLTTPRVTTYVPPEETPERGPLRSPEGGATVVTVQADVHIPHSPVERIVNGLPLPITQEFALPEAVTPVVAEVGPRKKPTELRTPSPIAPAHIPRPHAPPGPGDTSEEFIPSFISPIRQISPPSLKHAETEEHVKDILCPGALGTLESLLPTNPTKAEVAHVFYVLLEMHKKKIVRLKQDVPFGTIYVTRL